MPTSSPATPSEAAFLQQRSAHALFLYGHFWEQYKALGEVAPYPAKTMIGVSAANRRIAWITQLGKGFLHVVFPFPKPHTDNLCFIKIAPVPGDPHQFNHHFRMELAEDINEEVLYFMRLALEGK